MLKAMSITRNSYDDMPGSVTEGTPSSQTLKNTKARPEDFKKRQSRSDWDKKFKEMKENEWVWK